MPSGLPLFRTYLPGATLSNHNRSTMRDVALQIYPLRADMARMRQFINSYLNFVDEDVPPPLYFKPAMPYVMLQILYYPYLAVTTGDAIRLTQREVSFTVPLECYKVNSHGDRVFSHYAACAPFLYLDVQPSITSGRDIFGLPKVPLKFQQLKPEFRPEQPAIVTDLRLRSSGPRGDNYKAFVKVFRDPSRFTSTRSLEDAVYALPDAIWGWLSQTGKFMEQVIQPPLRGYERTRDMASMAAMSRAGLEYLYSSFPALSCYRPAMPSYDSTADLRLGPMNVDLISLKQFRDAEDLDCACYQSVVSSSLYTDRVSAGGILFDPQSSDPSGGTFVRLYDDSTQPIMNSLGLAFDSNIEAEGGTIWTIKPDSPFWLTADLSLSLGTNLYWRTRSRSWSFSDHLGPQADEPTRYNSFGSGALEEDSQRFVSPDTWAFVLALPLAKGGEQKIRDLFAKYFTNDCLNIDPCFPFSGDNTSASNGYVYMLVYRALNSSEGRGTELEINLELSIPFCWSWKHSQHASRTFGSEIGYGVCPLYAFSDSEFATITQNEVFGRPTVLADIKGIILDIMAAESERSETAASPAESPAGFGPACPAVESSYPLPMLTVKTSVLGAVYSGDQPKDRLLLQIVQGNTLRSKSSPLPLDLVSQNSAVVPWLGFKQVVDCRLPKRASYQSIVMQPMKLTLLQDAQLSLVDFKVKIGRYASIPIAETLGLEVSSSAPDQDTTMDTIKSSFAAWAHLGMEATRGLNASSRAGSSGWQCAREQELKKLELHNKRILDPVEQLVLDAYDKAGRTSPIERKDKSHRLGNGKR